MLIRKSRPKIGMYELSVADSQLEDKEIVL